MNAPLVSIIVPVYNCIDYLDRCVQSLLSQEYKSIEIILVDDGSTDGSGALCDQFAQQDARVVTCHQPNQGLSVARNTGLKTSKGGYVTLVDADDFLDLKCISEMMRYVETYSCDIVQCKHEKGTADTFSRLEIDNKGIIIEGREALKMDIIDVVAWGKLYSKDLFSNIVYPPNRIHEDEFVTYKLMYKAKKVAFIENVLYYYYQSPDSIMRGKKYTNRYDFMDAYEERIAFFKDSSEGALEIVSIKLYLLRLILYYGNQAKGYKEKRELFRSRYKYYLQTKGRDIFLNNHISITEKMLFLSFTFSPKITSSLAIYIYNRRQLKNIDVEKGKSGKKLGL